MMWQRLALVAAALSLVAAVPVPLGLEAAAPQAPSQAEPSLPERAQAAFHAAQQAEARAFNRSAWAEEQLSDHISELKAQANSSSLAKDIEDREEAAVSERRKKLEDSIQAHLQQLSHIVQAQEAKRDSAGAKLQVMKVDRKAKKSAEKLAGAEARARKQQQLAQEEAAQLKEAMDAAEAKWQEAVHEQAAEMDKLKEDRAEKVTDEKQKDETKQTAVKTKAEEVAKEMEEKVAEAEKKLKEDEEAIGAQSRPKPATGGAPAKEVAAAKQRKAILPPASELPATEEEARGEAAGDGEGGDGEGGDGEGGDGEGGEAAAAVAKEKKEEEREALRRSARKLARSIKDEAAELAKLEKEKVRSMRQSYGALRHEAEAEMRDVAEAASQAAREANQAAQRTAALARWAGHENENGTDGIQESEAQLRVVKRQRRELEKLTEESLRRAGRALEQAEAQIKHAALRKEAELRRRARELAKRARTALKKAKKLKKEEEKQARKQQKKQKKAAKKLKKKAEKKAKKEQKKREAEKKKAEEAQKQPEAAQKNPSEFLAAGGELLQGSYFFLPSLGFCLCLALVLAFAAGHAAQLSPFGRRKHSSKYFGLAKGIWQDYRGCSEIVCRISGRNTGGGEQDATAQNGQTNQGKSSCLPREGGDQKRVSWPQMLVPFFFMSQAGSQAVAKFAPALRRARRGPAPGGIASAAKAQTAGPVIAGGISGVCAGGSSGSAEAAPAESARQRKEQQQLLEDLAAAERE
ncbi:unnamed protein product, partial [Polarella glacialis]